MKRIANICLHIINEQDDLVLSKQNVSVVPSPSDTLRFGGEESEQYYKVTRVVWIYDEPDHLFERVNIGVEEIIL